MLRVTVSASTKVTTSEDWPSIAGWLSYDAAVAMSTLFHDVRPDDVVVIFAPRVDDNAGFSALLWVEVSACMNDSYRVPGILKGCLEQYQDAIAHHVPREMLRSGQDAARVGFVPMAECV